MKATAPIPALLSALLFAFAGAAGAAERELPAGTPAMEVPAPIFAVDPESLRHERAVNATLRDSLATSGSMLYAPPEVAEIALREALLKALRQNLEARRSGLARSIAERAVLEAQAVFDPTFVVAMNRSSNTVYERVEYSDRFKPQTEFVPLNSFDVRGKFFCSEETAQITAFVDPADAAISPEGGCYIIGFRTERAAVQTLQFDQKRPEGKSRSRVEASTTNPHRPDATKDASGTLTLLQKLPWGPQVSASLQLRHAESYFPLNQVSALPQTYGSYERPWVSALTLATSVPLPGTRNWGPNVGDAMAIRTRRLQVEAAGHDVRAVVNTTLLQVESAWWDLVGAVLALNVSADALDLAAAVHDGAQRLDDEQIGTAADLAQANALVAQIEARRAQEFARLIGASERLHELLDSRGGSLLLPVGWRRMLDAPPMDPAVAERTRTNPEIERAMVAVRAAELARTQRIALTRPEIAFTASLQARQSNSVFGYASPTKSLAKAFDPDTVTQTYGLSFQRTLGNRAAHAAVEEADSTVRQQRLSVDRARADLAEERELARITLASAHARIAITERSVELAEQVYEASARLQAEGLVAAYETLGKLTALLDARTQLINARVAVRLAEAQLLASGGLLAERAGERSAQTEGDRDRAALLAGSEHLHHFGRLP